MDILLIEQAPERRVAVAKALWQQGHRITLASSVAEALEITAFMRPGEPGPDVVLIGERLRKKAERLRQMLSRKARQAAWIPLHDDFQPREIRPLVRRSHFRVVNGGLLATGPVADQAAPRRQPLALAAQRHVADVAESHW
jgi:hypothetical protein